MSGGACVAIISESLKLKAPSPQLEQCLRMTLQNPLVVDRVGSHPGGLHIYEELASLPQWDKQEQEYVQGVLREIVEEDLPNAALGDCD